jgi:hypothetical protein
MPTLALAALLFLLFLMHPGALNTASGAHDIAAGDVPGSPSMCAVPQQMTITYLTTTASFANPERGFYRLFQTHAPIMDPLTPAKLQDITDTLILRLYYMRPFTETSISDEYLQMITDDMQVLRDTGKKAIVRFAYRDNYTDTDPSLSQIMDHMDQLEPYLRDNSDVIAILQAGFLGPWGEWHDFRPPFGNPEPNWSALRQVVTRELEILPCSRMVQLRRPYFKYNIFDSVTYSNGIPFPTPFPISLAHTCTDVARIGYHNDCFLCSPSDCGTYVYTPTEYPYLSQETKYVAMGGETGLYTACVDYDLGRLECKTAQQELEQFHWSFLSRDWFAGTHEIWRKGGCFEEIERRLGYRLALLEGTFDQSVRPGCDLSFRLQIVNEGYAAPYNERPVELILRHRSGAVYSFPLQADSRFWLPGEVHTISQTVPIPLCLPGGRYDMLLYMPDPAVTLAHRPEYAIRLANQGTWEPETGYNRLNRVLTVTHHGVCLPLLYRIASE